MSTFSLTKGSAAALGMLASQAGSETLLLTQPARELRAELSIEPFIGDNGDQLQAVLFMREQRHSMTLQRNDGANVQHLADWIEAVANGTLDTAQAIPQRQPVLLPCCRCEGVAIAYRYLAPAPGLRNLHGVKCRHRDCQSLEGAATAAAAADAWNACQRASTAEAPQPTAEPLSNEDLVPVPRGPLASACFALANQTPGPNTLAKLRDYAFSRPANHFRDAAEMIGEEAAQEGREISTEGELEVLGLGYPLSKAGAATLWYEGFRSEPISVLEAWEAIGHDIGCNPSKQELLDSLRNMAAICEAHGNDMPRPAQAAPAQDERKAFEAWAKTQGDKWLIVGGLQWSAGTDDYASARTNAAWAAWQERATRPAQTEQQPTYVECCECTDCGHVGINDAHPTDATCAMCDWSGPSPVEDQCPDCGKENVMGVACPKCSGRYRILAETHVAAPIAQTEQQPEQSGLVEALKAMLETYGPPAAVADKCTYPVDHPITKARAALSAPVAQTEQQPVEVMPFQFKHPDTGDAHAVALTRQEVADGMEDTLYEKLADLICHCEPVGETNVVDCNCDDYIYEFELVNAAPIAQTAQRGEA